MGNVIEHPIPPLYNRESRVLILGSFPSVKSRESEFFYGHPQNRFWKVVAAVFSCPLPRDIAGKKELLLSNHIALWDSIARCEIVGSSDSSIINPVANDLTPILRNAAIERIYCNGKKSFDIYKKYIEPSLKREAVCLPSTSPANAAWSLEKLIAAWECIR